MWRRACAFFLSAAVLCGSAFLAVQRWERAEEKLFEYSFSADTAMICLYTGTKSEVVLPGEIAGKRVTAVSDRAFYENHAVRSVQFPASVQRIGEYAFYGCDGLEELILPSSLDYVGQYAFSQCPKLTQIKIPGNVTEIAEGAFSGMSRLERVEIDGVCRIGEAAFADCPKLKTVIFSAPVQTIEKEAFFNDPALQSVTLPGAVSYIGERAFGYICGQTIGSSVRASEFTLYTDSNVGMEYKRANGF
ncbi:MAG: leucine-rich repeat domain-containing protein [Acutalibacteraceae bacterium]